MVGLFLEEYVGFGGFEMYKTSMLVLHTFLAPCESLAVLVYREVWCDEETSLPDNHFRRSSIPLDHQSLGVCDYGGTATPPRSRADVPLL